MPSKPDATLVQDALAGDKQAFCALVERYKEAVFGSTVARLGDFHEAEEAAQEVFVRAYVALAQLKDASKFGSWLHSITANVCSNWVRDRRRRELPLATASTEEGIADSAPLPDREAELKEVRDFVLRAISQLPEGEREATTLYYVNGYTQRDIGRFLGVPHGTIRRRLHSARQRLKEEVVGLVETALKEEAPTMAFTDKVLQDALKRVKQAEQREDRDSAIEGCEETLLILDQMPESPEYQSIRSSLIRTHASASSEWLLRPNEPAIAEMRRSLRIAKAAGDHAEAATSSRYLGMLLCRSRQVDQGIRCFERGIEQANLAGDTGAEAELYREMACSLMLSGRRGDAERAASRFCDLADAANTPAVVAKSRAVMDAVSELPQTWDEMISAGDSHGLAIGWLSVTEGNGGVGVREHLSVTSSYRLWHVPASPLLGWPVFVQAFAVAARALRITKRHRRDWTEERSSAFDPQVRFRGSSTIESNSDTVTCPAGRFGNCIRIDTTIEVAENLSPQPPQRDFCGRRSIWLAPEVGLVRARYYFHNGAETEMELTGYSVGERSSSYFPLGEGNVWRYEQRSGGFVTKELCRVVRRDVLESGEAVAHISCSNWSVDDEREQPLKEAVERVREAEGRSDRDLTVKQCQEALEMLDRMRDRRRLKSVQAYLMRQHAAAASEWLLSPSDDAIVEMRGALRLARAAGDQREAMESGRRLGLLLCRSDRLNQGIRCFERAIEAAERTGHSGTVGEIFYDLVGIVIKEGKRAKAFEIAQDYRAFADESGDPFLIAGSQAAMDVVNGVPESWWQGRTAASRAFAQSWLKVTLGRRDAQVNERVGIWPGFGGLSRPYSPLLGWPALFIAFRTATRAYRITKRQRRGWTEHFSCLLDPGIKFRGDSIIRSTSDVVRTPAGRFEDCLRIDTTIGLADGTPSQPIQRDLRGRRSIWLAPGVGLVRVRFRFENGATVRVELVDYSVTESSSSYMPLDEGNHWRYEQHSGNVVTRDLCRAVRSVPGDAGERRVYISCSNWSVGGDCD